MKLDVRRFSRQPLLNLRALLLLSQVDKPGLPMKDFLRALQPKEFR